MIELPEQFKNRMKKLLGDCYGEFLSSYEKPPYKAVRVNTLKLTAEQFEKIAPFPLGERVAWEKNAFYVAEEKAGKTVEHAAGLYYVQEPSAMCAAPLLAVKAGEKVLDLCSAPGGKGTQLAQSLAGEGVIVLNEINFSRAKILSQNVERLGVTNAVVTCASPREIAEKFAGYFEKVLVDAPCSGEGMFKKEPNAIPEWSERNVEACAQRQKEILDCAQKALKKGGLLVYSTCTFSPEEDEKQVEDFLRSHPYFSLIKSEKLFPHEVAGEGHYAALMQKNDGESGDLPLFKAVFKDEKLLKCFRRFEEEYLNNTRYKNLHLINDALYSIPQGCPTIGVQCLRAGVRLGEFKNGRFQPDHSLAMAISGGGVNSIEVDRATALSYLAGNTFACPQGVEGWALVRFNGFPLGWCKAVGGTAKNHYPKGLRI